MIAQKVSDYCDILDYEDYIAIDAKNIENWSSFINKKKAIKQ